jgi:hypothetical protein
VVDDALLWLIGLEDAPTLMFFPAFGDSALHYKNMFASDPADRYRLIVVDL